ncbi:unnamed protein product [Prorocentrum cordatum]|uniref:Uncharacterized protein n=1 Tax=Prorocentrum cordatum TaxID=2364126 RepID=A0ABN9SSS6_9DINO|nr:unnamed protein product [Polarella glacialis]|mmetsp:Transcript_98062/g.277582  ORF Transcript_98062/g.277582 Transcript_98062/m.277582 type:complete len:160 (-) Transcript_98062:16-495(-)
MEPVASASESQFHLHQTGPESQFSASESPASKTDRTRAVFALIGDQFVLVAAEVADGPAGPACSPPTASEAEDQDESAAPPAAPARTRRMGEDQSEGEDQDKHTQAEDQGKDEAESSVGSFKPHSRAQRRRQQRKLSSLAPKVSAMPWPGRLVRGARPG